MDMGIEIRTVNDVQLKIVPLVTEGVIGVVGNAFVGHLNQVIAVSFRDEYQDTLGKQYTRWDYVYDGSPEHYVLMQFRSGWNL